jgi:DNA-binding response OmpR family regulator
MKPSPQRILAVEDDAHIALGLREVLTGEGFEVIPCARGDLAVDLCLRQHPDLVLLDVMLPGLSGYDVCRQLRSRGCQTPILMLTAKGQELDKVVGLQIGADDYVTKPFGVRELVARIQALLRRSRPPSSTSGSSPATAIPEAPFEIAGSRIDPRTFELRRDGSVTELTARELQLLQLFHARAGEVLSRDQLLNEVWGHGYYGTTRTLDQVIVQLRRKLGDTTSPHRILLTVHGVGYRLAKTAVA